MMITVPMLRHFASFHNLTDQELLHISSYLHCQEVDAEQIICREGERGDCCYLLYQGEAQISKELHDGKVVRLATITAGEMFGQSGLIPQQLRTAHVHAKTRVVLFMLRQEDLERALHLAESWAFQIFRMISTHLARQLRSALQRLDELETSILPGRAIENASPFASAHKTAPVN